MLGIRISTTESQCIQRVFRECCVQDITKCSSDNLNISHGGGGGVGGSNGGGGGGSSPHPGMGGGKAAKGVAGRMRGAAVPVDHRALALTQHPRSFKVETSESCSPHQSPCVVPAFY